MRLLVAEQRSYDRGLVKEISEVSLGDDGDQTPTLVRRESKLDWFKLPKFYLFGICYMCVRLYTNIFGTLLPFYLIDVLKMGTDNPEQVSYNLALVPMLAYGSSVIVSTQLNRFYLYFGRKKALFVGTAICIGCLIIMTFLNSSTSWVMYILPFFIGIFIFSQGPLSHSCYQLELTSFRTLWAQREKPELLFLASIVYLINFHVEQLSFWQEMPTHIQNSLQK